MKPNSPIGEIVKGGQPSWAFDMQGMSPFWVAKAKELHRVVEFGFIVWREDIQELREYVRSNGLSPLQHKASTLTVSFFLAALAIENLLKAILVRQNPDYIRNGKFRGKTISSHNLVEIAAKAAVDLTSDEQDFCELGTESILHFGRYHIGKSVSESPRKVVVRESAFPVYEALYPRLKNDIEHTPFMKCIGHKGGSPKG